LYSELFWKDPKKDLKMVVNYILMEAIGLWKRFTKFMYLYSDLERYLVEYGNIGGIDGDFEGLPNS
jgi:hypothetical protein